VRARLVELGVASRPGDPGYVLCCPGAAFGAAKLWPAEHFARALDRLAAERGLVRILDPGPYRPLSDSLLARVDVLTPNETEAALVAEMDVIDRDSAALAGRKRQRKTNGEVVITLAQQGCVWVSTDDVTVFDAPAVESLDSTGAGDAFNGALAYGLANGESMEHAIGRAVVAGSASTLRVGAAASMPTLGELEPFLVDAKG